jgi:hypothetical protein
LKNENKKMFDKNFWAAAACLAGFGLAYYLNNSKKSVGSADAKLVAVAYKVEATLYSYFNRKHSLHVAG